jgi:hypothetical protein
MVLKHYGNKCTLTLALPQSGNALSGGQTGVLTGLSAGEGLSGGQAGLPGSDGE